MRDSDTTTTSHFILLISALAVFLMINPTSTSGQIFEPEGLSMPGGWNGWTNPPVNNLALASSTQVTNGRVVKIASGITRWQTIFSVAATGGDVVGGAYSWLFTSGPTSNPWGNKWGSVAVAMNTLQSYTKQGNDNSITVVNGKWYTMNWKDSGYTNTQAIFMETSAAPVNITDVSIPENIAANTPASVTVTTSVAPCAEELFYILYSTNNFSTSFLVPVTMTGNSGTATIPGQVPGAQVKYYAFSTTVSSPSANYDLYSLKINNNAGVYFSYTTNGLSSEAEILSFSLAEQTGPATINSAAATVSIEVAYETSVTELSPAITVSNGASVDPASGALQDFTFPVVYLVTAQDGTTTKNWTVTVTIAGPPVPDYGLRDEGGTLLPTFTYWYSGQPGDVTEHGSEFNGKNLGELTSLNIKGASFLTWKTGSGDVTGAQFSYKVWSSDFAEPADYTTHPVGWSSNQGDGNQTWASFGNPIPVAQGLDPGDYNLKIYFTISGTGVPGTTTDGPFAGTFSVGKLSNEAEILSFTLSEQAYPAAINSASSTVNVEVVSGTILTALTATITISEDATIDPGSGVAQDFTNPVTYTVTSESGVEKMWVVTVTEQAPAPISWANLQWPENGTIAPTQEFFVYAQAYAEGITAGAGPGAGLQAWIGYSTQNSDPSTWTEWVVADYFGESGNNDEYRLNLGALISVADTFYYASRFKLNDQQYVYGGFPGGFWDGTSNISGQLIVASAPEPEITWANLQHPSTGVIGPGQSYNVYGQVFADGITTETGQGAGIEAWIGISSSNTDPSLWPDWVSAAYNGDSGNNDEYLADIGPTVAAPGTYYYTTRYRLNTGDFVYGGYSASGGGFWDGINYTSGVVTVTSNKTLNITGLFIEGLYAGGGVMNQAQTTTGAQYAAGICDQITIELHDAVSYNTIVYSAPAVDLSTTGAASLQIPAEWAGQYYITIKGRNIIETTSAVAVSFNAETINHAYTNPGNIYGSNLVVSSDGQYLIYSGDLNADGNINAFDMILLSSDVAAFTKGYTATDLNGDGAADGLDMVILDNNAALQIARMIPE